MAIMESFLIIFLRAEVLGSQGCKNGENCCPGKRGYSKEVAQSNPAERGMGNSATDKDHPPGYNVGPNDPACDRHEESRKKCIPEKTVGEQFWRYPCA